jgi:toxin-antitoxin system PIN domain toxin
VILPDVNILVYAFLEDSPHHQVHRRWLESIRTEEDLLLPDAVLSGFLRIVSNRRVQPVPAPIREALAFVSALASDARVIDSSRSVWRAFSELIENDEQLVGNRVPDAYLAAVAISHGARLATRDRGFGRFPGLRWFDPASVPG